MWGSPAFTENHAVPDVQWEIRGPSFGGCNCDWNCPCQYSLKPTHGHCQGLGGWRIEQGYYGDTRLDGLLCAFMYKWPGAIEDGNGEFQAIIDERANEAQRAALTNVLYGRATAEGTFFDIMASTTTRQYDPLLRPIEFECDQDARTAKLTIRGLIEAAGEPIQDPHSGEAHRIRLDMPEGFEFTFAEIGNFNATSTGEVEIECRNTYGQWALYHFNQDGVVRS